MLNPLRQRRLLGSRQPQAPAAPRRLRSGWEARRIPTKWTSARTTPTTRIASSSHPRRRLGNLLLVVDLLLLLQHRQRSLDRRARFPRRM
ncbi:hypothetical protein BDY24DRAFT_390387 [Mrakia frigida]|uniref:uncharacterized protein n=1 Tax=Mrakia frigida TaxID=29902 RepID=UPI003FCC23CB